jgi:cytochrome bd-type quinol oxidase subunit 2
MLLKTILILLLFFIIYQLFRAMVLMLKTGPGTDKMSVHLGRRVGFSVLVIVIIVLALLFGWLEPHPTPH